MIDRFDLFTADFIYRKIQLSEQADYAWANRRINFFRQESIDKQA